MECIRCKKRFDDAIASINAENYGGNFCACPHCGKLYRFCRTVAVAPVDYDEGFKEDDWGVPVVPDSKYNKGVE